MVITAREISADTLILFHRENTELRKRLDALSAECATLRQQAAAANRQARMFHQELEALRRQLAADAL